MASSASQDSSAVVLNADAKTLSRMAPLMQRVLIVDPAATGARLLTDLLRDLSHCQVWTAETTERGLNLAERINPHIIFVEQTGAVDGVGLTRELRRGDFACRKVPVIMVTSEATAAAILAARDAGAHEFLRKPYTIKDLMRRLEAVTLRQRDWVEAVNYIGPDRRRFNSGDYSGPLKRGVDAPETPELARIIQALKILKAAIAAIDQDPRQALRAMLTQASELRQAAVAIGDDSLSLAADTLRARLHTTSGGMLSAADLQAHLAELWTFIPSAPDTEPARSAAA